MDISPVSRIPLSLEVSMRLREAIFDGTLGADAELPTEQELAKSFNVGRSTIREALRVLQSQGLISGADSISTARPRVTHEKTADSAVLALSAALQVGAIPLADLVELRVVLEAESVRLATSVPEQARAAMTAMATATAAGDYEAFHLADVDFHVSIACAGGNKALGFVISVLRDVIAGYLLTELHTRPNTKGILKGLLDDHQAIIEAVDAGDRELAATLVVAHIRDFYNSAQPATISANTSSGT